MKYTESQHSFDVFRGYVKSYPSGANERRKGEAVSFRTLFVDKWDVSKQTVGGMSANKQSLSLKLQKTKAISNSHEGLMHNISFFFFTSKNTSVGTCQTTTLYHQSVNVSNLLASTSVV